MVVHFHLILALLNCIHRNRSSFGCQAPLFLPNFTQIGQNNNLYSGVCIGSCTIYTIIRDRRIGDGDKVAALLLSRGLPKKKYNWATGWLASLRRSRSRGAASQRANDRVPDPTEMLCHSIAAWKQDTATKVQVIYPLLPSVHPPPPLLPFPFPFPFPSPFLLPGRSERRASPPARSRALSRFSGGD